MDPLSNVLSLLKLRSYVCGGYDFGGQLAIQFPKYEGIKCYAVVSGQCWLSVDGVADAVFLKSAPGGHDAPVLQVLLKRGDCFLLPRGWPFRLATDLTSTPIDALAIFRMARKSGGIISFNGGGECFIAGGHFALSGNHAGILLGALPPIVHIRKESDKAAMRWSLERMMEELREQQPGGLLVAEHLAHMMLVQALRLHLSEGLKGGVGWLFALADKQMSAAISAMHDDPAHRWTLQELAERAGMSRSTFALKFKETVGESAMEYLTRWRMLLAGDRMANSSDSISAIAVSLGYESDSAFSTAFKRVMGCSPRQYSGSRKISSSLNGEQDATQGHRLEAVAG